jgi:8-oxo-dGTP pyrophosphatase MutT (NUDIX family)
MSKKLHEVGQLIIACETYVVFQDQVLMHKRSMTKSKFPGFWIVPGGHVEEGEDVLLAAIREIEEETGVILQSQDVSLKVLAFHHHLDRGEVWVEYLFRAEVFTDQKIHSTDEGETKWVSMNELMSLENVFPPSKYYLKHVLDKNSGIMYNASEWKNSTLVKVLSENIEKNRS